MLILDNIYTLDVGLMLTKRETVFLNCRHSFIISKHFIKYFNTRGFFKFLPPDPVVNFLSELFLNASFTFIFLNRKNDTEGKKLFLPFSSLSSYVYGLYGLTFFQLVIYFIHPFFLIWKEGGE